MSAEVEQAPPALSAAIRALEQIDDGFCALDRDLKIVHVNSAAERLWSRPRAELLGRPIGDTLPAPVVEALGDMGDAVGDVRRLPWIAPGGHCIEIDICPSADGCWLLLRDPGIRVMEEQLRERDELLTMAERSAGIGVWDIDLATQTVRGTPQFFRIMGLPPTDQPIPIETTRSLRLPDDRERVAEGFREVIDNRADSFEMEYRIRRPDGEIRWIFGRGRLIRDAGGRPIRYGGVDLDVTERRAVEAALADMNQELEFRVRERTAALEAEVARRAEAEARLQHAQKMDAIGQLTGGIAHDFNNLLTVISGNIEALERHLPTDDPRLRRFAETAMQNVDRAAVLTNRLLAFARRRALAPRLLDVNRLIRSMSDLLGRALAETISLEMRLAPDVRSVLADPNQLESAILNLAINARDAMPDGGTLSITTANASDGYVGVTIADTGSGMSREVRERAFEPFFTTKEPGQGTGLGLAQVYGFIEQSGGRCRLDSEPGIGTAVTLYLPSGNRDDIGPDLAAPAVPLARGQGETILVTEDDPEVRAYSAELLRELGYEVLTAADAATALHALASNPGIRLLFADLGLPGLLNGHQLARTAVSRYPALKALLTTGYSDGAALREDGPAPATEIIAKPFSSAVLAAKIREVLRG
jgi:PAS domain S-box-containing protein